MIINVVNENMASLSGYIIGEKPFAVAVGDHLEVGGLPVKITALGEAVMTVNRGHMVPFHAERVRLP